MTSISLTRRQIAEILTDMGLEPGDADIFWHLASRERTDPGCLARERDAYLQRVFGQ